MSERRVSSHRVVRATVVALLLALPLVSGCLRGSGPAGEEAAEPAGDEPLLWEGLGGHHFPISTQVPEAQRYFDQGMALTYGFNHDAAVAAFQAAARRDPDCAACFWGEALALGPNINAPMGPDAARQAYSALQQAQARVATASPLERELIEALAPRYAAEPPEDRAALDEAYAQAMVALQARHPENVDVAVLTAEALMDLMPWSYYDEEGQPREHTDKVLELLEFAQAREPGHVGANHYYIHAVEEYYPQKAVPAAERLDGSAPDAGHLVHMPSHIYWRVGRYEDAAEINQRAAATDEAFFARCRAGAFYRALYYPHNVHFLWAAASAEGRSELALTTARKLAAKTRPNLSEMPFLEEFISVPILTLVRFGRWDAVLGEPQPEATRPYLMGTWHYSRALAHLRKGHLDPARAEQAELAHWVDAPEAVELVVAGGTASAAQLLAIGAAHLEGELAAAEGRGAEAEEALERAVALQDQLVYMEPPPWFFPTRQALGAFLLAQGRHAEAEGVYRADLQQYPKNGWSLFGLAASLRGQGKSGDADWAEQGFRRAWARADVELDSSRF